MRYRKRWNHSTGETELVEGEETLMGPMPPMPFVISDIPAYASPITGKPVEGRAARREDLKKHGCREVDPSEYKPEYRNKDWAKKRNLPHMGDRQLSIKEI